MKLNIILLIILICVSVFVGYLKCILGTCFVTLPLLVIVAFVIAVVTAIRIFQSASSRLKKISGFSLLIVYPIISVLLAYSLIDVFTRQLNQQDEQQTKQRAEMAKKGIPEIGTITQSDQNYVYTCIPCKFKITFPLSWKYKTQLIDYNDKKDPYLTLYLSNPTLNPVPSTWPSEKSISSDNPQLDINYFIDGYTIKSFDSQYTNETAESNQGGFDKSNLGYKVEYIKINGVNYRISKKMGKAATEISDNYENIYAYVLYKNRKIIISSPSKYSKEPTADEISHFMDLLKNIQFID